ncbi:MAG: antibiotic biosynthesis monooxygenase [Solirubrobacterales bacterium]
MNVVQAKEGREGDFERAFLERERLLNQAEGFAGFELLRRDREREYVVLTRWDSEDAFKAWVGSDLFKRSHRRRDGELAHGNEIRHYEVLDVEVPA